MKAMFWTFIGVLMTANIAMADVIPDPSFPENTMKWLGDITRDPAIPMLVIGILVGSAGTWLIMRARKKNGPDPK